VNTWVDRFRGGKTPVEEDDRSGRPFRDDFSAIVSGYLERNPRVSCFEIAKNMFVPMTTISRILEEIS
jgi:hypothetical protein